MTAKIVAAAAALAALVTLSTAALAGTALASDHGRERGEREEGEEGEGKGRIAHPASDPGAAALYVKECGACHLAFPPSLSSAGSHRKVMAGLERHFGQNAELDPAVRDRLEAYLVEGAAAGKRASPGDPMRITEAPWFTRKHRKVGPEVVARPAVKTLANCAACHPQASAWDFEDDRVKIPR